MNIALVTVLYPTFSALDENHRITYAISDFVKLWEGWGNNVIVVRNVIGGRGMAPLKDVITARSTKSANAQVLINPCLAIGPFCLFDSSRIHRFLQKNSRPDVVIFHMLSSYVTAQRIARIYDAPLVGAIHASDISRLENRSWAMDRLGHCDAILARSESIRKRLLDIVRNLPNGECGLISSGAPESIIESDEFCFEKAERIANRKQIRFVTCASLIKLKNIDIAIRALAKVTEYEWQYTIVGGGPEEEALKQIVAELGINDRIEFVGARSHEESIAYMKDSDVFLMVSAPETFGLAYIEAMAKGCIVIGSRGFGIDGIVKDGENGFLCEPRDVDSLSHRLKSLFEIGKSTIGEIARNAHSTVLEHTQEKCAQAYLAQLEKIASLKR